MKTASLICAAILACSAPLAANAATEVNTSYVYYDTPSNASSLNGAKIEVKYGIPGQITDVPLRFTVDGSVEGVAGNNATATQILGGGTTYLTMSPTFVPYVRLGFGYFSATGTGFGVNDAYGIFAVEPGVEFNYEQFHGKLGWAYSDSVSSSDIGTTVKAYKVAGSYDLSKEWAVGAEYTANRGSYDWNKIQATVSYKF